MKMKWRCNECGCEFYYYISTPAGIVRCPQCQSTDLENIEIFDNVFFLLYNVCK